ncbi:MAG: hypothetical protein K1X83_06335 [Oligoflexia bacterium]|nr:hypothetical protein [Oligoflexia bacterium]
MDFAHILEALSSKISSLWKLLVERLVALDDETLLFMFWGGVAVILAVLVVGLAGLIFGAAKGGADSDMPAEDMALSESSVVLRDLMTKVNNLATQLKDHQLFVKQELAVLRDSVGAGVDLNEMQDKLEEISCRIGSFANLMREEYHQMKEDIGPIRVTSNGERPGMPNLTPALVSEIRTGVKPL